MKEQWLAVCKSADGSTIKPLFPRYFESQIAAEYEIDCMLHSLSPLARQAGKFISINREDYELECIRNDIEIESFPEKPSDNNYYENVVIFEFLKSECELMEQAKAEDKLGKYKTYDKLLARLKTFAGIGDY